MRVENKICVTVEEAAQLASVSYKQLDDWISEPDFPAMKIGERGGKRIIHVQSFSKWLENRCLLRQGFRF